MIDLHFSDGDSQLAGDSRNEAVKFSIKLDIFDDFFPEGFQSAAVVVKFNPGDRRNQPVGDDGRKAAAEEFVFPLPPPAADDVVSCFDLLDKKRDVMGIVLEIRVERDDNITPGMVESCRKGRSLAKVFSEFDDFDSVILPVKTFQRKKGFILASVIDEDDLVGFSKLLTGVIDFLIEDRQIFFLVVDRDDKREVRGIVPFHPD